MDHGAVVAHPVKAADADKWREALAWHFESFCRDGSLRSDDLWADVKNKRRQLWVAMKGEPIAAVLTTVSDDLLQTLVVTHAAGKNMRDWLHLWQVIEDWAKQIGCKRIEAVARPGWERFLDMKKTHVVLEKRL